MFRWLHAADLHLDSPLRGLEQYEGAPVEALRGATRRALENLVRLAIAERVAFVVIAGDVYDGDWQDFNTGLFFDRQMRCLRDARIPVYVIRGNHDAQNRMTKTLRLPDNVRYLANDRPETVEVAGAGVLLHGQGFEKAAVTADLSQGYPQAVKGHCNIGLLHTCATGRDGHEPYAPCNVGDLSAKGYDYWALGHIHAAENLAPAGDPPICFPGNLQGRHAREVGPKGCTLVTVENGAVVGVEEQIGRAHV